MKSHCGCACVCQVDAIHRKEAMKLMTEMFYAALFGYDEVRIRPLALAPLADAWKTLERPLRPPEKLSRRHCWKH